MTDREKVICAIKNCIAVPKCRDCPWEECEEQHVAVDGIPLGLIREALSLLKAQEPVTPIEREGFYYCGECKYSFTVHRQKYCSNCGKRVKWDAED